MAKRVVFVRASGNRGARTRVERDAGLHQRTGRQAACSENFQTGLIGAAFLEGVS